MNAINTHANCFFDACFGYLMRADIAFYPPYINKLKKLS